MDRRRDGDDSGPAVGEHRAIDLERIVEDSPDAVSVADPRGNILYRNAGARNLITGGGGHAPPTNRLEDARPQWAALRLHEEALPTALRDGQWQGESAILDNSGQNIPVSQLLVAHRNDMGVVETISCIERDLRQLKQDERESRAIAERETTLLQALVRSMPGTFYVLSEDGRLVRWNRNFQGVSGYSDEQIARMGAAEFFALSDRQRVQAAVEDGFRHGSSELDAELVTRTGERRPLHFSAVRAELDGVPYLVGIGLDMRERQALERSCQRLAAVVEASTDALFICDTEGAFLDTNPRARQLLGTSNSAGDAGHISDLFSADGYARFRREALPAAIRHGSWSGETGLQAAGTQGAIAAWMQLRTHLDGDGRTRYLSLVVRDVSARKKAEHQQRLAAQVYDRVNEGMMITDADKHILSVNNAFERLTGYRREEALGRDPGKLLGSGRHDKRFFRDLFATIHRDGHWQGEIWNRHRDGTLHAVQQTIAALRDEDGRVSHYISTFSDVTALKNAQREALEQRDFVDALLNTLPAVFLFIDEQGRVCRSNAQALERTGSHSLAAGEPIAATRLFIPADTRRVTDAFHRALATGQVVRIEAALLDAEGAPRPHLFTAMPIRHDGAPHLCTVGIDIGERKALEERLKRLATTDPLTGAGNRSLFEDHATQALETAKRYGRPCALVMFDIDHFKRINDEYGHDTGDRVLERLVEEVTPELRQVDLLCRWGGEEFVILAPETDAAAVAALAERVRRRVESTKPADTPAITVSLGTAVCHGNETLRQFVKRADDALYRAKTDGRNRVRNAG